MSRRRKCEKREIEKDYKYNSEKVTKLINYIMRGGKKTIARSIVYDAFDMVKENLAIDPNEAFEQALSNIQPAMQIKARRVGGATYQIPIEVREEKALSFALKWLVEGIEERALKDARKDLAKIIVDSYNGTGYAVSKRNDMHRQAEANKAFAHYRW